MAAAASADTGFGLYFKETRAPVGGPAYKAGRLRKSAAGSTFST